MKTTILAMSALLLAGLVTKADEQPKYEVDVADFTELKVINGVNVDYSSSTDSVGKAVFYATKEQASAILFSNKNGKLVVELSADAIDQKNLPKVHVYSRFLTKVENSGDSLVRVVDLSPTAVFHAKTIGNGRLVVRNADVTTIDGSITTGKGSLVITGKCDEANLSLVGTGSITADELKAVKVKARTTGTGTIGCWATTELSVGGAGSGKIYYRGTPTIKKNMLLGVKVQQLTD